VTYPSSEVTAMPPPPTVRLPLSSRLARVATAIAAIAVAALAQQRSRPTFARVLDADGAPLRATVTFVGGHPHLSPALQDVHVTEVDSDERGRCIARLQPGLCYVAWAVTAAEDGARARSMVEGYFAAGAMVELRCAAPAPAGSIELVGDDAWSQHGALRCFAVTSIPGTERELLRREDGTFEAPGAPFDRFEVRLPDGQPLWQQRVAARLELPPPRRVPVLAVDENGDPLAGARVWHRVGRRTSWRVDGLRSVGQDRMRLLGATGDDGRCEVVVPYDGDPLRDARENLLLFVESGDRPAVAGGVWNHAFYVSDHKVPRIDGDELRFECFPVEPLRGSVPAAPPGTVAHLAAICKLHLQRNSYLHDARVFTAEVQADGSFAFADVPTELHSCRLSFLPPAGSGWQPPVYPPEASRALPDDVVARVGTADPIGFGGVELQVLDALGGPARGGVAFVSSADRSGVLLRDSLLRVPLDERGQASLRMQPGNWVVVVVTDEGFGGDRLEVGRTGGRLEMNLRPLARTTVTLRGADGRPVPGARVRSRGTTTRGTKDAVGSIMQGLRATTRMHWQGLRTDAEGRVVIPFVPVEGVRQRVELTWDGGRSEEFALAADERVTVRETEPRKR
jgi:hypothetical protein